MYKELMPNKIMVKNYTSYILYFYYIYNTMHCSLSLIHVNLNTPQTRSNTDFEKTNLTSNTSNITQTDCCNALPTREIKHKTIDKSKHIFGIF